MTSPLLPPVAAEVAAEAVEALTARLRKKLDAAVAGCGERAEAGADGDVTVRFGEDAVVTLRPGPSGVVAEAARATCTCLLSPRCLHRAAVLTAAPVGDPPPWPGVGEGEEEEPVPAAAAGPQAPPAAGPEDASP
ncbi:SWIM zinc finger domain protein, partial [Streptomyces sp. RSD-27]